MTELIALGIANAIHMSVIKKLKCVKESFLEYLVKTQDNVELAYIARITYVILWLKKVWFANQIMTADQQWDVSQANALNTIAL